MTTGTSDITPQWVDDHTIVYVRTEDATTVLVLKQLGPMGTERVVARRARFPRVTANGKRIVFNVQPVEMCSATYWSKPWPVTFATTA